MERNKNDFNDWIDQIKRESYYNKYVDLNSHGDKSMQEILENNRRADKELERWIERQKQNGTYGTK